MTIWVALRPVWTPVWGTHVATVDSSDCCHSGSPPALCARVWDSEVVGCSHDVKPLFSGVEC